MNNFLPIRDMPRRPTIVEIVDLGTLPACCPPSPADKVHSCDATISGSIVGLDKGLVPFVYQTEGWKPEF